MNYGSSTSCWKSSRWVTFDLILVMKDVCINSNLKLLTKFTSSSRSSVFKNILQITEIITNTILISTGIVISYTMKQGIPFWIYWKVSENWDSNMIIISQWSESCCRTKRQNKEIHKSKRAGLWESQSRIWVGSLTIWVR